MLRVSYVNPLGYVVSTERFSEDGETKTKKFKYDLCFANIELFAEIEHTKTESRLHLFFANNDHLKRILNGEKENAKYFLKGRHYYFNSYYRVANNKTIELLNRLGAKVSFFYKEPKTKKGAKK